MSFTVPAHQVPAYIAYAQGIIDALRHGERRLLTFKEYLRTVATLQRLRKRDPGGNIQL